jgi:hypothetical protein
VLREWFCEEMARLGVADRYVDAFWGRTAQVGFSSALLGLYLEKLKAIYDEGNVKISFVSG